MKKRFLVILGLFLLVFVAFGLAITCTSTTYCQTQYNSTTYSCISGSCQNKTNTSSTSNISSTTTYLANYCRNDSTCTTKYGSKYSCVNYQCTKTTTTSNISSTTSTANYITVVEQVTAVEKMIDILNNTSTKNTQNIQNININIQKLGLDISSLKQEQQSLKTSLSQNSQSVNSVSTGLASLQKNVQITDTKVSNITNKLENVEKSRPLTKTVLFILFTIATFAAVTVFIIYKRSKAVDIPLELMKYIHQNLNNNQSYAVIRKELLKAGWTEEQADAAYKEVLSHRYKKHTASKKKPTNLNLMMGRGKQTLPQKITKPVTKSGTDSNKKKMLVIGGISLMVIIILVIILMKTDVLSGKAIQTQFAFDESKPFICTPPHIETVGGCCLDNNSNKVCDDEEEYAKNKTTVITAPTAACQDDNECGPGQFCINKKCGSLIKEYQTECANTKKCVVHDIAILTSDGEIYNVHAKQGSYTAAGALAWTIKSIPAYCIGAPIKVPIEIEKTDLVCYDDLDQKMSCDQDTKIACTTTTDCSACPGFYGVNCKCSQNTCIKDNIGKTKVEIVGKELITLIIGQTSTAIKHPNPGIDKQLGGFTLTLMDAQENCY